MLKIHIFSGDAKDTSSKIFGAAAVKKNAIGDLAFDITLKKVTPNTTYDIWINQYPVKHLLSEPTGKITTDAKGEGHISASVARIAGTNGFWISVTCGKEIYKSAAIDIN